MAEEPITPRRGYLSFLLRLWLESGGDAPLWRVSLERPQDGERLGFASLEDLFAFLEGETRSIPSGSQARMRMGRDEHSGQVAGW